MPKKLAPKKEASVLNIPKFISSIAICEGAGILGLLFTASSIPTWYQTLNKPNFSPPNWIFGPVWTVLYALMGIALYLIWQKVSDKKDVRDALVLFGIHLVLNSAWTILFFGLRSPFFAFIEIVALWIFIVAVMYKFWQIDKRAGLILLPYLLWVSFATVLNYTVWQLNKF